MTGWIKTFLGNGLRTTTDYLGGRERHSSCDSTPPPAPQAATAVSSEKENILRNWKVVGIIGYHGWKLDHVCCA
jgi:hypothetical protein